eukprot:6511804-Prymnesium_polylepis.1
MRNPAHHPRRSLRLRGPRACPAPHGQMVPGTPPPGAAAAITAAVGCKGKRPATIARRSRASAS